MRKPDNPSEMQQASPGEPSEVAKSPRAKSALSAGSSPDCWCLRR